MCVREVNEVEDVEEVHAKHSDPVRLRWVSVLSEGMSFDTLATPGPVRVMGLAMILDFARCR